MHDIAQTRSAYQIACNRNARSCNCCIVHRNRGLISNNQVHTGGGTVSLIVEDPINKEIGSRKTRIGLSGVTKGRWRRRRFDQS